MTATDTFDPELKRRWIEALRSGEYQQGTGTLAEDYEDGTIRYCCLGVLCEVAGLKGDGYGGYTLYVEGTRVLLGSGDFSGAYETDGVSPFGLDVEIHDALVKANDGIFPHERRSFAEIADWLESSDKDAA